MTARSIGIASVGLIVMGAIAGALVIAGSLSHAMQEAYRPKRELPDGTETVMVYIGDGSCGACGSVEHKRHVRELKLVLSEQSARRAEEFVAIGVAMDWNLREGWEFLQGYGAFDEVALGRNWAGSLVQRYVFQEFPGKAAVPQVLILEREASVDERGVLVANERLIRRLIGTEEISAYLLATSQS